MLKVVTFFLIGMVILAVFGKLRAPRLPRIAPRKCDGCGTYLIGGGPCRCKNGRG